MRFLAFAACLTGRPGKNVFLSLARKNAGFGSLSEILERLSLAAERRGLVLTLGFGLCEARVYVLYDSTYGRDGFSLPTVFPTYYYVRWALPT